MKKIVPLFLIALTFVLVGWYGRILYTIQKPGRPEKAISKIVKPTPFTKYQIDNLSKENIPGSEIVTGDLISETPEYSTYKYFMEFNPDLEKTTKKVSGVINIPKSAGPFPVIVMFRGFVSQETYVMGVGTQPSARVFAKSGYITVAPDFLGYGESDNESSNIFESRFQTWVTAIATLKSVGSIKTWDGKNIFIWGHSNGGQIALTVLEATGVDYPTVLWAPVSMRFPASILYYIGDAGDGGKYLISKLADFEEIYDTEKFSLTNYFSKIKAPIQINQGTSDTAVPYWLTDSLNKSLKDATVSATYIKYPGADHNMRPSWDTVVENNLKFFKENLK